ncbi:MAG: glycogen debranching enzyme, partial [Planctomycetota bacterium]
MDVWRGDWYPLGATWTGAGTNFALFSEHATKVELCLFDAADATQERDRVVLPERTHFVWHGFLPEVRPGQLYGFRVHGPYEPEAGRRFNPHKIVLDPYARMLGRDVQWDANLFGYEIGHERADL